MTASPRERRRIRIALWFALLGGAAAWSAHLLGIYFATELACVQGATGGSTTFRLVLAATSVVAVAVAVAAVVVGLRQRARLRDAPPQLRRIAGLGAVGTALGIAFALLVVLESVPLLILGCGGA